MKKGDIVSLDIVENVSIVRSKAYYEDRKIMLDGGLVGQTVEARISKLKTNRVEARILEVTQKAPYEIDPKCAHFGRCGGCKFENIPYSKELELKQEYVVNLFKKAGISYEQFEEIVGSPVQCGYRNKMEFSFGDDVKEGPLTLGMHERGKHHNVVSLGDCNISPVEFNIIRCAIESYFSRLGKTYFNKITKIGYVRHLVLRKSFYTGEILINLVTSTQDELNEKEFVDMLLDLRMDGDKSDGSAIKIAGIIHTINDSFSDAVKPEKVKVLYGNDFIIEKVCNLLFKITPFSFFQTNSIGAEILYGKVLDYCGDIDNQVVFDLYSGTGTIAQIMAQKAEKVYGIEIVEESVESAKQNAIQNELGNCEFLCGDVFDKIDELNLGADVIILDPPRAGLNPRAIEKILQYNCKKIIYISCKTTSLITDLPYFTEAGYTVDKLGIVDMFPRTEHVECVVLLSRIEK